MNQQLTRPALHIAWVNETATLAGGAERYIHETAKLLAERGVRSTMLYEVSGGTHPSFTGTFEAAFPLVDPRRQLEAIDPDAVYIHRLGDEALLPELLGVAPTTRFFHDHALFCPRTYKYTTLRHRTCDRAVGAVCYPCLGVVNRSANRAGFRLRTVGSVKRQQSVHDQCDALVVGSDYMRDHVVANGLNPDAVHVIRPFVQAPRSVATQAREPGLLVFAGTLVRGKGLDVLLEALPDVSLASELVVIGSGDQEPWFRELAESFGVADRVTFTGKLPKQEVHEWFARAACVVVPSRTPETFCLVGAEALLHETPVVASEIGGMVEWLKPNETGIGCPSGDPAQLAVALEELLSDRDAAAQMGRNGKKLVEARFSPKQHTDELLALFESQRQRRNHGQRTDVRYTARGGVAAERRITEALEAATAALERALPQDAMRSVVLLGGYGRGEGGVITVAGEERPHNNFDLLVITRGSTPPESLSKLATTALTSVEATFDIDIDVGAIAEKSLRRAPCMVMWYDMRFGHRTLLGDRDFVPSLEQMSLERVLPWDVRNLMVNRGTLLLINQLLIARGNLTESDSRAVVKHMMKAIIGYGDALLFSRGAYHWSYEEKGRRMRARTDIAPAFQTLYDEAIEFRFRPDYAAYASRDLDAWHEDVLPHVATAHLECEQQRLNTASLSWASYANVAFPDDLLHRDTGLRAVKKAREFVRTKSVPRGLSAPAYVGYRAAGAAGRLPILFPLVMYGDVSDDALDLARVALGAYGNDPFEVKRAYLREWMRHGDPNSRWGELL